MHDGSSFHNQWWTSGGGRCMLTNGTQPGIPGSGYCDYN
jgi:hypothetical protein